MTKVVASGVSIDATGSSMYEGAAPTSRRRWKDVFTAWASKGVPSWNLTPLRSLKV
jgi:hypothetical protein